MKLTNDQLWARIEDLDWAGEQKGKPFDYTVRQAYGFDQYGTKGMETIHNFAIDRKNQLYNAIMKYEGFNGHLDIGSDDGLSDLVWHVIGLGESVFHENLENPRLLEERYKKGDYKESFAYVFHKPEPPKSKRQKNLDTLNLILKRQSDLRNLIRDAEQLSLQIDRLITDFAAEIQGK